jgi:hypothetical protein
MVKCHISRETKEITLKMSQKGLSGLALTGVARLLQQSRFSNIGASAGTGPAATP